MKQLPISFIDELIPAVMDGSKTRTMRVIVPQPIMATRGEYHSDGPNEGMWQFYDAEGGTVCLTDGKWLWRCPYEVGDLLWVKEGYQLTGWSLSPNRVRCTYLADGLTTNCDLTSREMLKFSRRKYQFRKTSGRFMYKSLARTWLVNTKTVAMRVQDISEEEARAEGVAVWAEKKGKGVWNAPGIPEPHRFALVHLWDSINKSRGYPWEANNYVWAIDFKRTEKP